MKIKYLFNSALLIDNGSSRILIDGLIDGDNHFDAPDLDCEREIYNRTGMFCDLDLLLFTHCHGDHFCDKKVYTFSQINTNVKIVLPDDEEQAPLCVSAARRGAENIRLLGKNEKCGKIEDNEICIKYYKTGHISSDIVGGNEHYCFLIKADDGSVLVTADFDLDTMKNLQMWCGKSVDNIFINSLAIGKPDLIKKMSFWEDSQICIYHIPQESNDLYGYRKMALFNAQKAKNTLKNCCLADGKMAIE